MSRSISSSTISGSGSSSSSTSPLTSLSDADIDAQIRALVAEKQRRENTLIIGAAGAIGKRLCAALAAR